MNKYEAIASIVAAVQVCCEEEHWPIVSISTKENESEILFGLVIDEHSIIIGCDVAVLASLITEEEAVIAALEFRAMVSDYLISRQFKGMPNNDRLP